MPQINKRRDYGVLLSVLIIIALLCYLIAFGIINFAGFDDLCTTDMYEDTLIARLMWEQKTLFPSNYLFGNQFYVIATPVLAALFYGISGSMNIAMGLATTVMSVLILITLSWMLKAFIEERHYRYAILLAMVAACFGPLTVSREDGQLFFVMCSFYACYLIVFFFLMGDYARARVDQSLRPAAFFIALLLSFCTGMQSLRQTCVSMLPILAFEFFLAFLRFLKKQPLWPKGSRMSLIRAVSYLAANIAGVVFIKLLGVSRNEIYYGQSIFSGASIAEKVKAVHDAIITVSGFDFARNAAHPFFIIIFLFFTLIEIYAFFSLIRKKDFFSAQASFWWLCIISILAVIAASFVTSVSLRPIYLFPCYTLPALSLAVLAKRLKPKAMNILCTLLVVISIMNIHYSYGQQIEYVLDPIDTPAKQVSDFAVENGYEYVYGSHSYTAPLVAAFSDGKLIAGCWDDEILFKISPHINIKNIYHRDDYSKAVFVFTETEVPGAMSETQANGTTLYFQAQFGPYHVYTASNQLLYPISELIDFAEKFPEYN